MTRIEVELLTDQKNNAVLRLPGRSAPGILVQGDSLHVLTRLVAEADEGRSAGDSVKLADALVELARILDEARESYEGALARHSIPLPYVK